MPSEKPMQGWKDKVLFTPGPLTTSRSVKQAMLSDLGSRDTLFIETVKDIRKRLLELGGVSEPEYCAILMQGSGTFGLEATVTSVIPKDGKLLVAVNGAYGRRMVKIAEMAGIAVESLNFAENQPVSPELLKEILKKDSSITHVSLCHCETTSGILNPLKQIGEIISRENRSLIVDAMSSFGAIETDLNACHIDFLISSANKCIEGVPGFSFILAKKDKLLQAKGNARSLSFDIVHQYEAMEANGQFRFTPPTHAILAFHQALIELEEEGGVKGRYERYSENHKMLLEGMRDIGFKEYLAPKLQSPIIASFLFPEHEDFDFTKFYRKLSDEGYVIYPGKVGDADCFRIGSIGRIFAADVRDLIRAIEDVLIEMEVIL